MKKITFIILLGVFALVADAQQSVQFTNYMYNTLSVNPGYAGSREALSATILHRSQWVGIEGAPVTQTFSVHSPMRNQKMGLGFSLINDKIGPVNETSFTGDYSYTIKTSKKGKLAFGLKASLDMFQGRLRDLKTTQTGDSSFDQDIRSELSPNFGFGMYYHTPTWYAGASAPKLLENTISSGNAEIEEVRHYYIIGGYIWKIDRNLKFKPTVMTKFSPNSPVSVDLTAQFLLDEKLWLGAMFRFGDAAGALVGYQFTDQLKAGYSYDHTVSGLTSYNNGSHEIFLSFDFIFRRGRVISPRYF